MRKHSLLYSIVLSGVLLTTVCLAQEAEDNAAASAGWYGIDLNETPCRGGGQGYGPYDYTNPAHRSCCLDKVERVHFTAEVENLSKGNTTVLPTGDLDYTLRVFPNHHRALLAMIRFQLLNKDNLAPTLTPAECYLQRAAMFSPSDPNIPFLYGFYLHKKGLYGKALEQYKKAENMAEDHAALHYYMANLYLDLQEKEKAAQHADKAATLGISKMRSSKH